MNTPRANQNKHHVEEIEKFFDTQDQYWDTVYKDEKSATGFISHEMRERKRHIFDLINPYLQSKRVNVLDCGCGAGGFIIDLIKNNNNVVGVDISHKQLVKVIDLIQNVQQIQDGDGDGNASLVQADCERLPFPDDQFDVIICVGVLQYLASDHILIKELSRVAKPDGLVIVTLPNIAKINNILDPYYYLIHTTRYIWYKIIKKPKITANSTPQSNFNINKQYFNRRYRYGQLTSVFKSFGFSEEKTIAVSFGEFTIWRKKIFSKKFSIKLSDIFVKIANKNFSILKIVSNRWIIFLKKNENNRDNNSFKIK